MQRSNLLKLISFPFLFFRRIFFALLLSTTFILTQISQRVCHLSQSPLRSFQTVIRLSDRMVLLFSLLPLSASSSVFFFVLLRFFCYSSISVIVSSLLLRLISFPLAGSIPPFSLLNAASDFGLENGAKVFLASLQKEVRDSDRDAEMATETVKRKETEQMNGET